MTQGTCPVCKTGEPRFSCKAVLYPGCEREIHACSECLAAYYWPAPSQAEIARCYPSAYYSGFFKQYWKDYYKGRMLGSSLSRWKESGAFLDVGCATGNLLAGVRDHSRWTATGLEFNREAAAMGRSFNRVEIACAPLSQAPWPKESFDYIHLNNVVEHEADPVEAMSVVARLLKPGGRLHLTIPNGPVDLLPTRELYRAWNRAVPTRHGGHLFFFSRKSLLILLEGCGLQPLSIANFHFKLGMKARGWWPRAYNPFKRAASADPAEASTRLELEQYRRLVPVRRSWWRYRLGSGWRRAWRLQGLTFGYDFEIHAKKE